jgi:coenzyme F420-reducing hydrogenase delta subunit
MTDQETTSARERDEQGERDELRRMLIEEARAHVIWLRARGQEQIAQFLEQLTDEVERS